MNYRIKEVQDFAARITALGFKVYVAERGEYGFITDEAATRVLSFSFNDGGSLGGNYGPPSRESGTGWRISDNPYALKTKKDVHNALYSNPPHWCGKDWKHFTTVEQHLGTYQPSSRYQAFEPA